MSSRQTCCARRDYVTELFVGSQRCVHPLQCEPGKWFPVSVWGPRVKNVLVSPPLAAGVLYKGVSSQLWLTRGLPTSPPPKPLMRQCGEIDLVSTLLPPSRAGPKIKLCRSPGPWLAKACQSHFLSGGPMRSQQLRSDWTANRTDVELLCSTVATLLCSEMIRCIFFPVTNCRQDVF